VTPGATVGERDRIVDLTLRGQEHLVQRFEELEDGVSFGSHTWERPGGGGGTARTISDGQVFERGGVNASVVEGNDLPREIRDPLGLPADTPFFACGLSLVLHPRNPHVPIFHANFRYFEVDEGTNWWFGGGADLTPAWPREEDVREFHGTLQALCNRHDVADYPHFKRWCDRYFTVRHRREMRGVGGIFFDHLHPGGSDGWERSLAFMKDGIETLADLYPPLVKRRMGEPWSERERAWQLLRRGRYAEFNLIYDRGTRFGLETGGNPEAILMSLPPLVRWETLAAPDPDSAEAETLSFFQPRDWTDAPTSV